MTDAASREPDVVERLLSLTRRLRPERRDVGDGVVLCHPGGRAFAAAEGGRLLVRTLAAPGTLGAHPVDGRDGWVAVDPWPADVGFRRGTDVLREVLAQAFADSRVDVERQGG